MHVLYRVQWVGQVELQRKKWMHTNDASKGECRTAYPVFHTLVDLYI